MLKGNSQGRDFAENINEKKKCGVKTNFLNHLSP